MQIQKVTNVLYCNNAVRSDKQRTAGKACSNNNLSLNNVPSENIKANFLPSFGRLRNVGTVTLTDRNTKMPVKATVKKDSFGSSDFQYQLYMGKECLGYMDLLCDSLFPEDLYVISEPDDIFPEIRHLRSLRGDKYEGIGSSLVSIAVEESRKRRKGGAVWLSTEKGYAREMSNYRKDENPIPFYYKLGFRAVDSKVDKLIQECIKNTDYNKLPPSALLLLSSSAANAKNKYLAKTFTIK